MFRATLCPSSGADDLVVFFHMWCSAVTLLEHYNTLFRMRPLVDFTSTLLTEHGKINIPFLIKASL